LVFRRADAGARSFEDTFLSKRRVVVTGLGIICPVGNSPDEAWRNAANGVSGAQHMPQFEELGLRVTFGAPVKNYDPAEHLNRRDLRRTDPLAQVAHYASKQALEDSGLAVNEHNAWDVGVIVGTGIGGFETLFNGIEKFMQEGHSTVSPLLLPADHPFWTAREKPMPADNRNEVHVISGSQMVIRTDAGRGESRLYPVGSPRHNQTAWQTGIKYYQHAYSTVLGWAATGEQGLDLSAGRSGVSLDGKAWVYRTQPSPVFISERHNTSYWMADLGEIGRAHV